MSAKTLFLLILRVIILVIAVVAVCVSVFRGKGAVYTGGGDEKRPVRREARTTAGWVREGSRCKDRSGEDTVT